jgi:hypothetical protein
MEKYVLKMKEEVVVVVEEEEEEQLIQSNQLDFLL